MYRSNRKKAMWRVNKPALLVISIALMLIVIVGATIAYHHVKSLNVKNQFVPEKVTCEVYEPDWNDGDTTKSNVQIENTSEIPVYIRATWIATWQLGGEIVSEVPKEGTDYKVVLGDTGWIRGDDGYYYCNTKVQPGDMTPILLDSVTVLVDKGKYQLHVEIIAEAVQARPDDALNKNEANDAVNELWPDNPLGLN